MKDNGMAVNNLTCSAPTPGELSQVVGKWKRTISIRAGYDMRPRHGVHGMHLTFVLSPAGTRPDYAVFFEINTGWTPSSVKEQWGEHKMEWSGSSYGCGVGTHSSEQRYEWESSYPSCRWLGGQKCFCSDSGMDGRAWFEGFVQHGVDWVWKNLEEKAEREEEEIAQLRRDRARFS